MSRRLASIVAAFAWLLGACGKSSAQRASGAPPDAATSAAAARAAPAPPRPESWRGTYESTAASIYIPPDWKVRYAVKDDGGGIGSGTLSFRVDPKTSRVTGALEGPLGPASLDGVVSGGRVAADVARVDPNDHGFTGTLAGTVDGGRAEGTMHGLLGDGNEVRAVTFEATPAGATH